MAGVAVAAPGGLWLHATAPSGATGVLAAALILAVALAYKFPIYLRHDTKVLLFTVPLYLLVVVLPPALGLTAVGLGVLGGQLLVRKQFGNYPSDIATHVGRWTLLATIGTLIAHAPLSASDMVARGVFFLLAALFLWAGDMLSVPLEVVPMSGERPRRIIASALREGGLAEAAQYGIGIVGALVTLWHIWALALFVAPTAFIYLVFRREADPDTYQLLESMADAVDLRNPFTTEHSRRVVALTQGVLRELGARGQEATFILMAARLHDIGAYLSSDEMLLNSGPLTSEERTALESRTIQGVDVLKRYPDFAHVMEMIQHRHECWDGRGYPDRLRSQDIPFGARVIAVTDSFDAMISDRPYRRALSIEQAAEVLRAGSGRQWDPGVVQALLRSIAERLACEHSSALGAVAAQDTA
jgi:HD-GYP domain-containing protein (c-di-GMP phosphodiesterase class II)